MQKLVAPPCVNFHAVSHLMNSILLRAREAVVSSKPLTAGWTRPPCPSPCFPFSYDYPQALLLVVTEEQIMSEEEIQP